MTEIVKNNPQVQAQPKETPSKAEVIAKIQAMKAELKRLEASTGSSGAVPNTPSAMILDANGVQASHPEKRLRWVSVNKAQRRQMEGYVRVPESELPEGFGTAARGNLILMMLPREKYEERVAEIKKRTQERLTMHVKEMENEAEALSKYLRDNRGIKMSAEEILLRG